MAHFFGKKLARTVKFYIFALQMAFEIQTYTASLAPEWDRTVENSRNGTFLLRRPYMDYHSDRFEDRSLVVRDDRGHIAALFAAACRRGASPEVVTAHAGLTYGGLIVPYATESGAVMEILDLIAAHLRQHGARELVYRPVPHIYHRFPCQEDIYWLWSRGATMDMCQLSATLDYSGLPAPEGLRAMLKRYVKANINRAARAGIVVEKGGDLAVFHAMLTDNLAERHNVAPVHSLAELRLLCERFPDNISLWSAHNPAGIADAGVLMYVTDTCAHCQYITSTPEGRENRALTALLHTLIEAYAGKRYFDFGTSNEDGGHYLNAGLLRQKNSYGARGTAYPSFRLHLEDAIQ